MGNCFFFEKTRRIVKFRKLIRPLAKVEIAMPLRYNKILKLFAILIFSFDLLAPVVLIASPEQARESVSTIGYGLSKQAHPIDLLSQLLFEEVGSEEREGKNNCFLSVCFVEVYSQLQKFQPIRITWSILKDQFDTKPSLFTLNRALLI